MLTSSSALFPTSQPSFRPTEAISDDHTSLATIAIGVTLGFSACLIAYLIIMLLALPELLLKYNQAKNSIDLEDGRSPLLNDQSFYGDQRCEHEGANHNDAENQVGVIKRDCQRALVISA